MKTKEEILEGYFGSDYWLLKERDDLQYILRSMDEYANQFKQLHTVEDFFRQSYPESSKWDKFDFEMVRFDAGSLMDFAERYASQAACASGAVDTVAAGGFYCFPKPPKSVKCYEQCSRCKNISEAARKSSDGQP